MDIVPIYFEPEVLSGVGATFAMFICAYFMWKENKAVDPDKKIIALLQGVFWLFGLYTLTLWLSLKANSVLQSFGYPPRMGEIPLHPSNQETALLLLQTKREIERITFIVSTFMIWLLLCFVVAYGGIARIMKMKKEEEKGTGCFSADA